MKGGTLFSGIGAPECAAPWVDWRWCAEIDRFPAAVHAARFPGVSNLGDVTKVRWDGVEAVDLVVWGSPCQAFSVAGRRAGLDDPRGDLTLVGLAAIGRIRPRWMVWENVPGVLSIDRGRTFGTVLGLMGELGYGVAYRVLNAQHFGVPQRRRRVFVVGCLGDWRRAAAVLFERDCLSGNSAAGREAREDVAPTISARPTGGGGLGTDFDLDGGVIIDDVARCDTAGYAQRIDWEAENFVAHALRGEGFDASEDGTGRGTPLVPVAIAIQERAVCENPNAGPDGAGFRDDGTAYTIEARSVPQAVAFDMRGREGGAMPEGPHDTANIRAASGGSSRSYLATPYAVRRLTPRECERLQGFPDDYTAIPYRGKIAADGPRYKALGNSMAVPVLSWLLDRIRQVDAIQMARAA